MIEIDIPSIDPIQHEPKIFFGLTSRQCLCVLVGGALAALSFLLLYEWSQDAAIYLSILFIVPAVLLGWYSPYNMRFEDYAKLVFFNTFVANPKRIYKTDMEEDRKQLTIKERQELEKKQRDTELKDKRASKNKKKKKEGASE